MNINLLPIETKEKQTKRKIARKVFLLMLYSLLLLGICTALLYLSKYFFSYQLQTTKQNLIQQKQILEGADFKEFQIIATDETKFLQKIKQSFDSQILFEPTLQKVVTRTFPGISFSRLSFKKSYRKIKKEKKLVLKLQISGIASSREKLYQFKKEIEKEKIFENIQFSPASWIAPVDANFSLTFEINKNRKYE